MKKNRFYGAILLCLALLLVFPGCGVEEPAAEADEPAIEATAEPVLPTTPTELCREFLEVYLTSDFEGRYTQFTAAMENITPELTQEESEKIIADYHAAIRPYISDALYEKMCRNRDLSRWDGGAEKLGVTMIPTHICLEAFESLALNFNFHAIIQLDGNHDTEATVTGRITVNGEGKIDSVQLQYYDGFPSLHENTEETRAAAAEYFRQYYIKKAEIDPTWDAAYMDLTQIDAMVSSTAGVVVDTEELTIEVLGAMFSGNTAEIKLLVTANELESVWNDNETKYSTNYQFADVITGLMIRQLEEEWCYIGHRYAYSEPATPPADTQATNYSIDKSLAPNQFTLSYTIVADKLLETDTLSIPIKDLARYIRRGMSAGHPEPLYEGIWQVDITVDPALDNSKRIAVNREIQAGEFRFLVEDIQLTPFTCMVHLTCLGDTAYIDENADAIFQTVVSAREDFTLHFADGTQQLLGIQLSMGSCEDKYNRDGGSYYDEYQLNTTFSYPLAVEDVTSITMFGQEFSLK